ncbi:ketoacyl-ACP synthase III [Pontibacter sp. FD36]|uniref:Beta-ketoacyl-[acyl-carrier-protein] synthase III n=1 Tax=Pontibacter lucknowensis TaxID=1077936 RepID=A0A1N6WK32_9BACT|nr:MULTISPECIES: beta-ketoacyl-ACP synthase III [Pontibacter]EJF08861.1 3-oxoacyl-ACP synthase [Pontibacter sp. BAB1700]MBF8962174.1 ketoacyl-ACP synthase III [Pontibacter sp. FD36]SIQ90439.1 3-oxoacyl-[acyl-carrier-protein] synthase-3 [Pontibacter lucknowensis]
MRNSKIAGVGHYVPEKVVTNFDLEKLMETSDEWIRERTGIQERRYFQEGVDTTSNMGAKASMKALEMAGLKPEDVDMIVFATLSPDYVFPGSGVLMQREMGLKEIPALDVRNQCSGFVYALSVADQFIKTGMYDNILVVGSEIHSNGLDFSTRGRNVSVIFGDGAGAVVLTPSESNERGILSTHLHSDGEFAEELAVIDPGSTKKDRLTHEMIDEGTIYPYMNGNQVFKHAVTRFPEVIEEALNKNGYKASDVDMLIPHQANLRITSYIQQKMGLPAEKVMSNIHKYGNTTAASVPIALSEAVQEGRIKEGDLVCMAAFGSGFTWASALIRW